MNYSDFNIALVPIIAFLITALIKGTVIWIKTKKIDLKAAVGTGGFPSGHTAIVTSLTTAVGLKLGFNSDLFFVSLIFSFLFIYDAINIRHEAGLHAVAINKLLPSTDGKKLKESLGHLPSEAFAGCVLGIIVAFTMYVI